MKKDYKTFAAEGLSVPLGSTGKRTTVPVDMVAIRMADGSVKIKPSGKSGSSGH
jgi:hypothetical protein